MHILKTKFVTSIITIFAGAAAFCGTLSAAQSDESIKQVLQRVSKYQEAPLHDGDYTPASSADALYHFRTPTGTAWNYPWGVTLYGMIRASDVLDNKSGLNFVVRHNQITGREYVFLKAAQEKIGSDTDGWKSFLRDNNRCRISGLIRLGDLDACGAMGVQMMELLLRQPNSATPEQRAVVERVADWIVNKQERLPDGTFWRPGLGDEDKRTWPRGTIWADDLYMSCPFLVRWAQYKGENKHIDDAARQIINMASRMQESNGVWFHAYNVPLKECSPIKWGRANGWVVVTTVEVLSAMNDDHPLRPQLLTILRRHLDGLKPMQAKSGLWRQVLDSDTAWEETSCSAMFAYGFARAVNRGWIGDENMEIARKAFEGVCTRITRTGMVNDTCEGTGIGMDAGFYLRRRRYENDQHGRGPVLLAGAEILAAKK